MTIWHSVSEGVICKLCLKETTSSCEHHVIFRAYGGTDVNENLITLCLSCHAILTWGNPIEAHILETACIGHQLAIYGLPFLINSSFLNKVPQNAIGELTKGLNVIEAWYELEPYLKYIGALKYAAGVALVVLHYNILTEQPIHIEKMEEIYRLLKTHKFDIYEYRERAFE